MESLCFLGLILFLLLDGSYADRTAVKMDISLDCGSAVRIWYSETSHGLSFFMDDKAVDHFSFCQTIDFYATNGCFLQRQLQHANLRKIGEKFCLRDLSKFPEIGTNYLSGRKLLVDGLTTSLNSDKFHTQGKFSSLTGKLAIAFPVAFLLCCAFLCPCFRAKRKDEAEQVVLPKEHHSVNSVSSLEGSTKSERTGNPFRIPPSPLRVPPSPTRFSSSPRFSRARSLHVSIGQIVKATQNFSSSHMIAEGGFGNVYKAQLADGQIVAVKRARKEYFAAERTVFNNEVDMLSKIDHRNLVKILGCIDKGNERIIITEYVPNGTLRDHLDGKYGRFLNFSQRLEISIDVAHGLTYLHMYAEKPIIHRDIKSSNILLTEGFRAKVTDFGFAKAGSTDDDKTHISTRAKGTAGYLDPEYLKTNKLTPRSDVYSFGILLIETLSGRRPVEIKRPADEKITVRWAFKKYNEDSIEEILDPMLERNVDKTMVAKMLGLAFQCVAPFRDERPSMKETVEKLWEIRKEYRNLNRV